MSELVMSNIIFFLFLNVFEKVFKIHWQLTHMRVVQNVLSHTQILNSPHTSLLCMSINCTEIKTEIWIIFSYLWQKFSVFLQQKYSAMGSISGWGLELFEWLLYLIILEDLLFYIFRPVSKEHKKEKILEK